MSSYYYLIRDDNKSSYNLGKMHPDWYSLEKLYDAMESNDCILQEWNPIRRFTLSTTQDIWDWIMPDFITYWNIDEDNITYWKEVIQEVFNWADGKIVWIAHEDIECELRNQRGYKETGTRYRS